MIDGLEYVENYITGYQHTWLLNKINEQEWLDDLKRRVQHYGFKYDYRARKVTESARIGKLPEWLNRFGSKLKKDGYVSKIPDQVIVNEYLSGQGISPHIDCEPCFEDTIISLSLGSPCMMHFTAKDYDMRSKQQKEKAFHLWLQPRSILILKGEARYKWLHCIRPRHSDIIDKNKVKRRTRVSLTFRNVILK